MEVTNDKLKSKNWVEGDTFALKIKSDNPKYDGRYLILIKDNNNDNEKNYSLHTFKVKLTQDKSIPKTKNDIENQESIKTTFCHYSERLLMHFDGIKSYKMIEEEHKDYKYYPDEYDYLYRYHFVFHTNNKKTYNELIYLGNFNVQHPKDGFLIKDKVLRVRICNFEGIQNYLIESYENYNLKKSKIYDSEYRKELLKKIEQETKMKIELANEMYEKFRNNKE